jgi:hypothetical protein
VKIRQNDPDLFDELDSFEKIPCKKKKSELANDKDSKKDIYKKIRNTKRTDNETLR